MSAWTRTGLYIDAAVRGDITTVPEPSTLLLVGTALIGLAIVRRRRLAYSMQQRQLVSRSL